MELQGKVALVTGAANGIGRAITERFLNESMQVVAVGRHAESLAELQSEFAAYAAQLEICQGDISRREDVRHAVATAVQRFGRLDVMAANAGIADVQPFLDIDDESWRQILDVNLTGTFFSIQEAARVMVMQEKGAIVVTSSTNGFYVEGNLSHYNASKGGIDALVRSAALELAWHGIRVNSVAPSMVRTRAASITDDGPGGMTYLDRVPMGRLAEASEVAAAVAFLASDESSYMTGQSIILDGGLSLGIEIPVPDEPLPGSLRADRAGST